MTFRFVLEAVLFFVKALSFHVASRSTEGLYPNG